MLTGRHQQKLASLRTLLPERAWFLQNDGAKPEAAHALAESVESFGMLDGLWLNAGQLAFKRCVIIYAYGMLSVRMNPALIAH